MLLAVGPRLPGAAPRRRPASSCRCRTRRTTTRSSGRSPTGSPRRRLRDDGVVGVDGGQRAQATQARGEHGRRRRSGRPSRWPPAPTSTATSGPPAGPSASAQRLPSGIERRIRGRTESLARQFDRVLRVLEAWGYVDGWSLTDAGEQLAPALPRVAICWWPRRSGRPARRARRTVAGRGLASMFTLRDARPGHAAAAVVPVAPSCASGGCRARDAGAPS